MKIITQTEFVSSLWKNGAGTTREIARKDGPKGYFWRLSIAKVTCDSIFSTFLGVVIISFPDLAMKSLLNIVFLQDVL